MAVILPPQAANLAKDIYLLIDSSYADGVAFKKIKGMYSNVFDLSLVNIAHSRTGGPSFIKTETAFGLMAYGTGNSKKEAFIILRGTKILGDLLTDFNAMWSSTSVQGHRIHDGFSKAFQSLKSQLDEFIAGFAVRGITEVHCIGHSLGGALATLCADYINTNVKKVTYLYTFGSPRVGLTPFARSLSDRLEPQSEMQTDERLKRIFRVYHQTDIVACLPTWPYSHVPFATSGLNDDFQPSPGFMPLLAWHSMEKYIETVGNQKWFELRNKRFDSYDDNSIERWLTNGRKLVLDVVQLEWLERAIWYVLKKSMSYLKISIDFFNIGNSNFTIYDTIAYVFDKALSAADKFIEAIPSLIMALINKICSLWSGKTVNSVSDPLALIREVFLKFQNRLYAHCRQAIDSVLRKEVS